MWLAFLADALGMTRFVAVWNWGYGQRWVLAAEQPINACHHRVYLSKGQYNKLDKKNLELLNLKYKKGLD